MYVEEELNIHYACKKIDVIATLSGPNTLVVFIQCHMSHLTFFSLWTASMQQKC